MTTAKTTFRAFWVEETAPKTFRRSIVQRDFSDLPNHEVLVKVHFAGLNYKDALSASGNRGVTRQYPHTPGVDAAGTVAASSDPRFVVGDAVIVTSYDLGMNTTGGLAEYIRVPATWVVPLPAGLTLEESMILGTAGYTAALALYKMEQAGQTPDMGSVVVTGATGGVGSLAVAILAKAGYRVLAATGKPEAAADYLAQLGAAEVMPRTSVDDTSGKPLVRPRWAGGIDTVGGNILATLLKSCARNGSIAACGLVASPQLATTVFPFILNGVNLLGVDSAETPMSLRLKVWAALADRWKPDQLSTIGQRCSLDEVETRLDQLLRGEHIGRTVVCL